MRSLSGLARAFDRFVDFLPVPVSAIVVFVWLTICAEVVSRYFLGKSIIWATEVTEYAILYITFLGSAWLLKREGHVKVDLVFNYLPPRYKAFVNVATSIMGTIVCLVFTVFAAGSTWQVFEEGVRRSTLLSPPSYIVLAIVPVGGFILFVQFIRRTQGNLSRLSSLSLEGQSGVPKAAVLRGQTSNLEVESD